MVNANSCRLSQYRAVLCDGDMDGQRVGSEGGIEAQRCRGRVKHCGTGALRPRQWPGVVDVHARVHPRPLVTPEQPPNLVVPQPAIQRLAAGNHAVLSATKLVNVHQSMLVDRQRHSEACGQPAECRAGYGLAGGAVVVVTGAVVVVVVGAVVVVVVSVVVVSVVVGVVSSTVVVVGTTVSVTVCVGAGTTGADVATEVVVVVVVDVVVVVVVEGESDENSCTRA
ncbi:hypothetical protein [Mycolicibacterium fortuitum]|uniref:hypothetical protein n=1 Tax=Mycolicibacterium fortuitum TaxID=1766 RepID=UPI000AF88D74